MEVVSDEKPLIEAAIINMVDKLGCHVVVTTGGTGPARDVTPEATEAVCERILPGFGEQMRQISLQHVPTAILSRQIGGTRGQSHLQTYQAVQKQSERPSMKFGKQFLIVLS